MESLNKLLNIFKVSNSKDNSEKVKKDTIGAKHIEVPLAGEQPVVDLPEFSKNLPSLIQGETKPLKIHPSDTIIGTTTPFFDNNGNKIKEENVYTDANGNVTEKETKIYYEDKIIINSERYQNNKIIKTKSVRTDKNYSTTTDVFNKDRILLSHEESSGSFRGNLQSNNKKIYYHENGKVKTVYDESVDEKGNVKVTIKKFDKHGNLESDIVSTSLKKSNQDTLHNFALTETKYDKKGNKEYVETININENNGQINHKRIYPDGREEILSSVTEKDGIMSVTKNFTSPSGAKTNYNYQEDRKGNSSLSYKITKNGKIILDVNRTYKKLNANEAESTLNGQSYHIKSEGNRITVTNKSTGETTEIDLNKFVKEYVDLYGFDKDDKKMQDEEIMKIREMLKKQPGDVLINMKKELDKIVATNTNNGCYDDTSNEEKIIMSASIGTLMHELGHAMDFDANRKASSENDKNLATIIEKENQFLQNDAKLRLTDVGYFLKLKENIAEANAVTSVIQSEPSMSLRSHFAQIYFAESFAKSYEILMNISELSVSQRKNSNFCPKTND